jgi:hypothetical protein
MIVRRFVFGLSLALALAPRLLPQVGVPLFSTDRAMPCIALQCMT